VIVGHIDVTNPSNYTQKAPLEIEQSRV